HIGWIFFKHDDRDHDFTKVPDFLANKLVMWQHRWYVPLGAFSGFALPALIGWTYGDAFGGFLWGGLIRIVLVHHFTFSINSFAHWLGSQPYSEANTARDSWITALISYGEGYHNFHHAFAADYRNGIRWYQYDPTKWLISGLQWLGLVGRVTRVREEMIQRAMLETQHRRAERMISAAPSALRARLEPRIAGAKERCEAALREWAAAKVQLAAMKRSMIRRRDEAVKLWKLKTKTCHLEFQAAQLRWAFLMAALSRLDHASSFRHFLS
ncbi:MAG: fatty acid desaturase, partial [Elusimicrobiota bacterium]